MLGYVHKDQNQPHFQVRLHNINPADVIRGQAEWQTAKLSYEDDKIMITKPNVFHRLSTYRLNADPESDHTFLEEMTNMLNTKKYMVSTAFITQTGALRLRAAEAMWKLVKGHSMTVADIEGLFFQQQYTPYRPGAAVPGERFFDAPGGGRILTEPARPSRPLRASWQLTTRRAPCPLSQLTAFRPSSVASWMRTRRACAGIHLRRLLLHLRCARPQTPLTHMPRRRSVRIRLGLSTRAHTIRMPTSSMTLSMMMLTPTICTRVSPCARATAKTPCK